jgi:VCBS repeat-containing protein
LTIGTTGAWTYTLDNSTTSVNSLNVGSTALVDHVTVQTADGTQQVIDITISGSNDIPTSITGITGSVHEDFDKAIDATGASVAKGKVVVVDADNSTPSLSGAQTSHGTYGDLVLNTTTGDWTYTLGVTGPERTNLDGGKSGSTTVADLTTGQTPHDLFHFATADGTKFDIDIFVNGHTEKTWSFDSKTGATAITGFHAGDSIHVDSQFTFASEKIVGGNTVLYFYDPGSANSATAGKQITLTGYVDPVGHEAFAAKANYTGEVGIGSATPLSDNYHIV